MDPDPVIAVIPARARSDRIIGKNAKILGNKPLFVWSIDCARAAGIDTIIVTTEDHEIATIATAYGAEVYKRPIALAADGVSATDAILDVYYQQPRRTVALLPTWPFRSPGHVRTVGAFTEHEGHVITLQPLRAEGRILLDDEYGRRVEPHRGVYRHDSYIEGWSPVQPGSKGEFCTLRTEAQLLDIDTPADWAKAEWFAADDRRWRTD